MLCVLWLHKYFAAYLVCKEWLFQSKLLFYHLESVDPFSSDLLHQEGIFTHRTAIYWMFFFPLFTPFFVNQMVVCENPHTTIVSEHIVKYLDWPVWHQQP